MRSLISCMAHTWEQIRVYSAHVRQYTGRVLQQTSSDEPSHATSAVNIATQRKRNH
jgi:hypothetical protein